MTVNALELPPLRDDLFAVEPFSLRASRCRLDRQVSFPVRDFCPACAGQDVELIDLPTEGTLTTYSTVHQAPPGVRTPYRLGYVELEGPVVLLARIDADQEPVIGSRMRLVPYAIESRDGDKLVFAFTPEEGAS